ncbi:MAG: thiamine pyrophosphate-dependent enzyme [Chloroflexota bacterium]
MAKVTGGEAIVTSLLQHNISTLFALPGVQNDHFFNALFDAGDKVNVIHTRHEQGAAYMALGAAMSTGGVGAYSVVPGPGLLNTFAALATAYSLNARVMCLTGQIHSARIGRGFGELHEIPDQFGMMDNLTKWATRISSPAEAPEAISQAYKELFSGRPRPVGIECPPDVLPAKGEVDLRPVEYEERWPLVDMDAVDCAAEILGKAKHPMIFVGSGAIECADAVLELAEALQAPVVSGSSGSGIVSSRHYLGMRQQAAYKYWAKTDAVIAIGSRIHNKLAGWGTDDQMKLIRIDIDPEEHTRGQRPDVRLIARSQDVVPKLVESVRKYNSVRPSIEGEINTINQQVQSEMAYLEPQLSFVKAIRDELDDDGIVVSGVTQVGYIARYVMPFYQPRTYLDSGYQGTLGWCYPTALGAKVANPDKQVVAISGDGGFMFNVQELATAVQHNINAVLIVFNDSAFGNVRRMQKEYHGNRFIATELHNPDFVSMAESFGAQGLRAHNADELRQALRKGFDHNGPTLIEVPVGELPNPGPVAWVTPRVRGS